MILSGTTTVLSAPEEPELRTDEDLAAEFDVRLSENPDSARELYVATASAAQRLEQEHAKATAQRERSKMKAAIAEAAAQKAEAEKTTLLKELDKVQCFLDKASEMSLSSRQPILFTCMPNLCVSSLLTLLLCGTLGYPRQRCKVTSSRSWRRHCRKQISW